ncbi:hypothetical protein PV328_007653 [Microctonus aethiopoides]|uniref:Uncharacterized protein n=1 Tax=Microctonus aethiopoides TaxID=144406 RepID=A0AA39C980_9HYME|nr:hypothetical protein PV328_007653 [Microctonus aethiopoides]
MTCNGSQILLHWYQIFPIRVQYFKRCFLRERARTLQLSASCQCHGQEYWDGQRCFSLVPAGGTWDKDGMISSPAASERYPSKKQERFLSLVPAVRIVRVHVLPSTADSEHVSDTEWYGIA